MFTYVEMHKNTRCIVVMGAFVSINASTLKAPCHQLNYINIEKEINQNGINIESERTIDTSV